MDKIKTFFSAKDFDIRKSHDARFMDQKVTPDVLCIMADCVLNYVAGRDNIEFTKNDIWESNYFDVNVRSIFSKPGANDKSASSEYDKFTSQPLRMLAYSGVLSMRKEGRLNIYQIANEEILYYIALKERSAFLFLYIYIQKVLSDSGLIRYFNIYKEKGDRGTLTDADFLTLRDKFIRFIIGNTPINGETECRRIYPKVFNIYAVYNNLPGSEKGRMTKNSFYYSDLMYNRTNWRDGSKSKSISRQNALDKKEQERQQRSLAYSDYLVRKAMAHIKKMYSESEVKDQYGKGNATQVHHIFLKSEFPEIAHYLENLIKLTANQHFTKAHPNNNTHVVDRDYQLVCLLAKSESIEASLSKGEFYYSKESFIKVINTGLEEDFSISSDFKEIRRELARVYNAI